MSSKKAEVQIEQHSFSQSVELSRKIPLEFIELVTGWSVSVQRVSVDVHLAKRALQQGVIAAALLQQK